MHGAAKVRVRSRSARISGRQSIDGTPAFRGGLGPRLRGDDVFWEGGDSPCARIVGPALIPAAWRVWHPAATVVCDGTWVGPFTVLVATGGARKESGMARDPGGPVATVSGEASAMGRSRRPP